MNNQEWLQHYIQCIKVVSGHKAIAIYSLDFKFLYVSDKYLSLTGATPEIIGKSFRETNAPGVELSDQLQEISLTVDRTGKKARFLLIYDSPIDKIKRCYWFEGYLVQNPKNKETVCRVGEIQQLNLNLMSEIFNFSSLISPSKTTNNDSFEIPTPLNFSLREQEILFLLLIGKSYKEIAAILSTVYTKSFAPSTISSITSRQLLPKFKSFSVENMLNKAVSTKVLQHIPSSLLAFSNGIHMLEYTEE